MAKKRHHHVDVFIIKMWAKKENEEGEDYLYLNWIQEMKLGNGETKSNRFFLYCTNSNIFREFYYNQMEKFARQALAEGITDRNDIFVSKDSELFKVLNTHYNRNNHIKVRFLFVSNTKFI